MPSPRRFRSGRAAGADPRRALWWWRRQSPFSGQLPASAALAACAAWFRAAWGDCLPSSTATIALPSACEIAGYDATWGRAFFTLERLLMNVFTPGRLVFIWLITD